MFNKIKRFFNKRGALNKSTGRYQSLVERLEKNNALGEHRLGLQIQTVSTCNASCYFCPYLESWHKENPGVMQDGLYRKIIDEVSKYRISKFCPYLENEPLLDKKIFDRIEYGLSKLNFEVLELSTNAALLDADKLKEIVRIFPNHKHEIRVSFHGVDKESFESIMGLDFERCLSNTLDLIRAAQSHDLNIMIRGSGMPALADAGAPVWFNEQRFLSFWEKKFSLNSFRKLPKVSFFKYHDRAGSIKRNEVNFSNSFERNLKDFYCERIDGWFHFLYTGEVVLCCMDYHKKTVFGNIKEQSLEEIFSSTEYLIIARQAIGLECSGDDFICKKCICPGG